MVHTTRTSSENDTQMSGEERSDTQTAVQRRWRRGESSSVCSPFPSAPLLSAHLSSWRRLSVSGRRRRSRTRARAGGGARHGGRHTGTARCSAVQKQPEKKQSKEKRCQKSEKRKKRRKEKKVQKGVHRWKNERNIKHSWCGCETMETKKQSPLCGDHAETLAAFHCPFIQPCATGVDAPVWEERVRAA